MKKEGFTLVELLAVIAILAILVIMALPAVLRMYRQSRINNFQNEVRSVYRTAQNRFLGDSTSLTSGQKILYTNVTSCTPTGVDQVKQLAMTGNNDFKYYVLISVSGKVLNVRATNGTYSYSIQASDQNHDIKIEDIDAEINNESTLDTNINSTLCPSEEGTYKVHIATCEQTGCIKTEIGTELIIDGENFYVISSDARETVLLAKYSLNVVSNQQSNDNASAIIYSDDVYWNGKVGIGLKYEGNYCSSSGGTNCAYIYDNNSNLYEYVNAYVNKITDSVGIKISGRILSLGEVNTFKSIVSNATEILKSVHRPFYWLGSAATSSLTEKNIWVINSSAAINIDRYQDGRVAIRPVIIVPTPNL